MFSSKEIVNQIQSIEKTVKQEVLADLNQLKQMDSSYDQKMFLEGKALELLGLDNNQINRIVLDKVLGSLLDPFISQIPTVSDHNDNKADTLREVWDFIFGFKDGVVGVTGADSKSFLCNANLSIADTVWYWNYYNIINDDDKWTEDNSEASLLELFYFVQDSLQWPYFVLYNCYWAGYELYTPIDEYKQPVLPFFASEDGETKTLTIFE
jgi:hypothetical protein